jgi:hypothetical protein
MVRNQTIPAILCVAALAACGADRRCSASASVVWVPVEHQVLNIHAEASGDTCENARATMTVENMAGRTIHRDTHEVAAMRNTIFESANSPETLASALANWINPANNTTMLTTAALPEWPAGAAQPANAEFPFYPEASITREAYARLRTENRPLFCYVQGSESMACLALDASGQTLTKIGLQTFPG